MIRETAAGVELDVRVIPRARKNEIGGIRSGALLVRLAAPPVEGAANAALIRFLASRLDLPHRTIRVVGGERSRHKRIEIAGISATTAEHLLASALR